MIQEIAPYLKTAYSRFASYVIGAFRKKRRANSFPEAAITFVPDDIHDKVYLVGVRS